MLRTQALCRPSSQQNRQQRWSPRRSFVTWTFRLPQKRLSILLNSFFPFIDIWYFFSSLKLQHGRTMSTIVFLHWLPKSTVRFPAKKRWNSPPRSGCLGTTLPLPQSLYEGTYLRTYVPAYADVRKKFSRIDRLPNLLSNVAPLARYACRLRYENGLKLWSSANHKVVPKMRSSANH